MFIIKEEFNLHAMTAKKNVYFVVEKEFTNMGKGDESVSIVEERFVYRMGRVLNEGVQRRNGYWIAAH